MNKVRKNNFQKLLSVYSITCIAAIMLLIGCSSDSATSSSTLITGTITIASELDEIDPDFSGVEFLIVAGQDQSRDTLLNAVTDVDGFFSAIAHVPERGSYPLVVSRNNRVIHISSLVLAPNDTITLTGQLPDLERTLRVESFENRAMATYERLQRLYGRVATLAYGGVVSQDSIPIVMDQWSDLFWSMRDEYPGAYASHLSAIDAIDVLEGWNDAKVLERLEELGDSEIFFNVKLAYGGHVRARHEGLQQGLDYLRNLRRTVRDADRRRAIDMRSVELMLDYQEYELALDEARVLVRNAGTDEVLKEWAEDAVYKLENLIPGRIIPSFTVEFDGSAVRFPEDLATPFAVLEVVLLADRGYQQTYAELQRVNRSVPDGTVSFYTIPLDQRQATIDAFFEERRRNWSFSSAGAYDAGGIIETLRIEEVPTRIVMGRDGTIHARLVGHEVWVLDEEINAIIQTIN